MRYDDETTPSTREKKLFNPNIQSILANVDRIKSAEIFVQNWRIRSKRWEKEMRGDNSDKIIHEIVYAIRIDSVVFEIHSAVMCVKQNRCSFLSLILANAAGFVAIVWTKDRNSWPFNQTKGKQ